MNNPFKIYPFIFNLNDDYDPTYVNPDQYHYSGADLDFYFNKEESNDLYERLGTAYSKADSRALFLTGITSSQVINSLGYTPLYTLTGTTLSDYHISVSDPLFDSKYLTISAQNNIDSLRSDTNQNINAIIALQGVNNNQEIEIGNLSSQNTSQDNSISSLQTNYNNIYIISTGQTASIDSINSTNNNQDISISNLITNYNNLLLISTGQTAVNNTQNDSITSLQNNFNTLYSVSTSQTASINGINSITNNQEIEIGNLQTNFDNLYSVTTGQTVSINNINTTNINQDNSITSLQSSYNNLFGISTGNTASISTLQSNFNSLQTSSISTGRTISLTGINGLSVVGGSQNLSSDRTWTFGLNSVGVSGSYNNVTTDAYGRIISGSTISYLTGITSSQVTTALGYIPVTPNTLSSTVPTGRTISITGTSGTILVTGSTQDLSINRSWGFNLATVGTAGSYNNITTDIYGRIITGSTIGYLTGITSSQINTALGYTPADQSTVTTLQNSYTSLYTPQAFTTGSTRTVVFNSSTSKFETVPTSGIYLEITTGTTLQSGVIYYVNNTSGSSIILTLPPTFNQNDPFIIFGKAGTYRVRHNSGQTIRSVQFNTTTGTGYVESSNQYCTLTMRGLITNTDIIITTMQGVFNYI